MKALLLFGRKKGWALPGAFIFIVAIALYLNTLGNEYAYDDAAVMAHARGGVQSIGSLLTRDLFSPLIGQADVGIRWRPVPLVVSALEFDLFGEDPFAGHAINIFLYGLLCLALYITLSKMLPGSPLVAFIASLIFAAHPVHTEVVANIKSRDEILVFLFLALTLLLLLLFTETGKKKYFFLSWLAYGASLFSKENAITFLAVIPVFLFFFTGRVAKQILRMAIPFILIGAAYIGTRAYLFSGFLINDISSDLIQNPFFSVSFSDKLATISLIMGRYLLLLFFPHPLASDYSYNQLPVTGWTDPEALISAFLHAALCLFAAKTLWETYVKKKKKGEQPEITGIEAADYKPVIAFSVLFYIMTISVTTNLFFNVGVPMAERFLFLPSFGFCLGIAILVLKAMRISSRNELRFPPALLLFLVLLLCAFGYKTVGRNRDWKNNLTLSDRDVQTVSRSAKMHYFHGIAFIEEAQRRRGPEKERFLRRAISEEKAAAVIYPGYYFAYCTLGSVYMEMGMADSAIYYFQRSIDVQPNYVPPYGNLGLIYNSMKGDPDRAIYYLKKGLEKDKDNAQWAMELGVAFGIKGLYKESIDLFEQVKETDPRLKNQCNLNIGTAYLYSGNYPEALSHFKEVLREAPNNPEALRNMAEAYRAMRDTIN